MRAHNFQAALCIAYERLRHGPARGISVLEKFGPYIIGPVFMIKFNMAYPWTKIGSKFQS